MAEKLKLESGRVVEINHVGLDDRNILLDSVVYLYNEKQTCTGIKMMHTTVTKWLRIVLKDPSDEFILGLSFDEKSEIFLTMQKNLSAGEGNASSSK